mmetsp:Transcript_26248/g.55820  ORF Transcript_26248/g.55820 Transcript_26248/m.55820 type:complete len:384 (+) Transcript_26248:286-1437(+)
MGVPDRAAAGRAARLASDGRLLLPGVQRKPPEAGRAHQLCEEREFGSVERERSPRYGKRGQREGERDLRGPPHRQQAHNLGLRLRTRAIHPRQVRATQILRSKRLRARVADGDRQGAGAGGVGGAAPPGQEAFRDGEEAGGGEGRAQGRRRRGGRELAQRRQGGQGPRPCGAGPCPARGPARFRGLRIRRGDFGGTGLRGGVLRIRRGGERRPRFHRAAAGPIRQHDDWQQSWRGSQRSDAAAAAAGATSAAAAGGDGTEENDDRRHHVHVQQSLGAAQSDAAEHVRHERRHAERHGRRHERQQHGDDGAAAAYARRRDESEQHGDDEWREPPAADGHDEQHADDAGKRHDGTAGHGRHGEWQQHEHGNDGRTAWRHGQHEWP